MAEKAELKNKALKVDKKVNKSYWTCVGQDRHYTSLDQLKRLLKFSDEDTQYYLKKGKIKEVK